MVGARKRRHDRSNRWRALGGGSFSRLCCRDHLSNSLDDDLPAVPLRTTVWTELALPATTRRSIRARKSSALKRQLSRRRRRPRVRETVMLIRALTRKAGSSSWRNHPRPEFQPVVHSPTPCIPNLCLGRVLENGSPLRRDCRRHRPDPRHPRPRRRNRVRRSGGCSAGRPRKRQRSPRHGRAAIGRPRSGRSAMR
jgi:hypothetical protein